MTPQASTWCGCRSIRNARPGSTRRVRRIAPTIRTSYL